MAKIILERLTDLSKSFSTAGKVRKPVTAYLNGKPYQTHKWVGGGVEHPDEQEANNDGSIVKTVRSIEKLLSSYGIEFQSSKSMKSDSHYVRFKVGAGWHEIRISDHNLPDIYSGNVDKDSGYIDIRAGEYQRSKEYVDRVAGEAGAKKRTSDAKKEPDGLDEIESLLSLVDGVDIPRGDKINVRCALIYLRDRRDASRKKNKKERDRELTRQLQSIADKYGTVKNYVLVAAAQDGGDVEPIRRAVLGKSLTFSGWKLQGRRKVHGMDISIENRKGSTRRGMDADGHEWATKMHADYGYIRGTVGKDKDHVDAYVGPNPESTHVFIIHQNNPATGAYDEDKVMLGFDSAEEAKALYLKQYDRPGFFGSMEETDVDTFKAKAFAAGAKGKRLVIKKSVQHIFGVDPELVVGIMVEKEHTDDPEEARKIALDHIAEVPDYYSRLIAAGLVDEPGAVKAAKKLGIAKSIRVDAATVTLWKVR